MAKPLPRIDGEQPDNNRIKPGMEIIGQPGDVLQGVPASEGYIPRNVDVRMTRAQARILRDKLRALQDSGAKTADGKPVDNRAQAVRWIIENEVDIPK
jgi:hypothetical protein